MVDEKIIDGLMKYAESHIERCGVITSEGCIVEIKNVSSSPRVSFIFDKKQWLSLLNNNTKISAIWHTHPDGNTTPSDADLKVIRDIGYDSIIVCSNSWRYFKCREI